MKKIKIDCHEFAYANSRNDEKGYTMKTQILSALFGVSLIAGFAVAQPNEAENNATNLSEVESGQNSSVNSNANSSNENGVNSNSNANSASENNATKLSALNLSQI